MAIDWGMALIAIAVLAVAYYVVLPIATTLGGIGAGLGNAGAAVVTGFDTVGADIGNPLAAAQGNGTGFFGAVYAFGQSLNPATAATQAKWTQEENYNSSTTTQENQAVTQVQTAQASGNATQLATAQYNELMVEVNAYDGSVASFLTQARYNRMLADGLTSSTINVCMNAFQNAYSGEGMFAQMALNTPSEIANHIAQQGIPSATASTFGTDILS